MDSSSLQPFIDWLHLHPYWVVWSVFLIAFLESLAIAGVIIPGVVLLFAACSVAGAGFLSLELTLLAAFCGAVLGDGISFLLGKGFKEHITDLWPFSRYPHWLNNGQAFFDRYGGISIVLGRFVGPIRPVMPLIAGMMDMPSLRFFIINLLSALGWAPLYVLPGFFVGRSTQWQDQLPTGADRLIIAAVVIILLFWLAIRLYRNRRKQS